MRIGILGSGNVGQSLGKAFVARGHNAKIGSRTPASDKLRKWKEALGGRSSMGTFAEAAAHGEVIVLACSGAAVEDVIRLAGLDNFASKPLIDVTNPLAFAKDTSPGLFVGTTDSLGERVQRKLPTAKVVKCFNTVNHETMVNPSNTGAKPTMLICGNDEASKATVSKILKEFGWDDVMDVGGIDGARWLEALVPLWVRVATKKNSWHVGFKVVNG